MPCTGCRLPLAYLGTATGWLHPSATLGAARGSPSSSLSPSCRCWPRADAAQPGRPAAAGPALSQAGCR